MGGYEYEQDIAGPTTYGRMGTCTFCAKRMATRHSKLGMGYNVSTGVSSGSVSDTSIVSYVFVMV